ncbi:MAG: flagellar hook-length control protein FliK [Desulfobacteraceae bacterium]|nr:MAG: flagellar hook-length control protein FliK [Desulfobacteraceae bacterium]
MQCTLKIMELTPLGRSEGVFTQKLALKLPPKFDAEGIGDTTGGFAEIMAALMQMPAEQLNRSLEQFDLVALEGDPSQWVPLIDLSNPENGGKNVLNLVLQAAGSDNKDSPALQVKIQTPGPNGAESAETARPQVALPETSVDGAAAVSDSDEAPVEAAPGLWTALAEGAHTGRRPASGATQHAVKTWDQFRTEQPTADQAGVRTHLFTKSAADAQGHALQKANERAFENQEVLQAAPPDARGGEISEGRKTDDPTTGAGSPRFIQAHHHSPKLNTSLSSTPLEKSVAAPALLENAEPSLKVKSVLQPMGDENSGGTPPSESTASRIAVSSRETLQVPDALWQRTAAEPSQGSPETPAVPRQMETDLIRQIVQRMTLHTDGRHSHMQIKLKPELLGNLRMEIMTQDQNVIIRMTAETRQVKEILEHNIQLLKNELQQQGLHVQKVEISVAPDNDPWRSGQQPMSSFRQAQEQHQQRHRPSGQGPSQERDGSLEEVGPAGILHYGSTGEVDFFA